MPIKFSSEGNSLPHQLPISPVDRRKGRTEEKDTSIENVWVGGHYQKMSPAVAGTVLQERLRTEAAQREAAKQAEKRAVLDRIAEEQLLAQRANKEQAENEQLSAQQAAEQPSVSESSNVPSKPKARKES